MLKVPGSQWHILTQKFLVSPPGVKTQSRYQKDVIALVMGFVANLTGVVTHYLKRTAVLSRRKAVEYCLVELSLGFGKA